MRPEQLAGLKKHLLEMQSRVIYDSLVKQDIVPRPILPGDSDALIDLGGKVPDAPPPKLPPLLPPPEFIDDEPMRLDPPEVRRRRPKAPQRVLTDLDFSGQGQLGDTDVLLGPMVAN